jgi:L-alanine-DL-glutamate epimerase-like enolase superfamily enzyme
MLKLDTEIRRWRMREPFGLSRGVQTEAPTLVVIVRDQEGHRGWGEGCGVPYKGDTPQSMAQELEAVRDRIETGVDRPALYDLLKPGGARCALDAALWDLEAKRGGRNPFDQLGQAPAPIDVAMTIGIRSLAEYESSARAFRKYRRLKVKVDASDPIAQIQAVRRGAPDPGLIVDPNQAWSVEQLKALAPAMKELGVILLEQPVAVGLESDLDGYQSPVPLCADELVSTQADLAAALGRFQYVNIKLDKCGGLSAGLELADAVEAQGMGLMVGCMYGSSLAMAPAMVLAQRAEYCDLDGPLLQSEDIEHGFAYDNGRVVDVHKPALWG